MESKELEFIQKINDTNYLFLTKIAYQNQIVFINKNNIFNVSDFLNTLYFNTITNNDLSKYTKPYHDLLKHIGLKKKNQTLLNEYYINLLTSSFFTKVLTLKIKQFEDLIDYNNINTPVQLIDENTLYKTQNIPLKPDCIDRFLSRIIGLSISI